MVKNPGFTIIAVLAFDARHRGQQRDFQRREFRGVQAAAV